VFAVPKSMAISDEKRPNIVSLIFHKTALAERFTNNRISILGEFLLIVVSRKKKQVYRAIKLVN